MLLLVAADVERLPSSEFGFRCSWAGVLLCFTSIHGRSVDFCFLAGDLLIRRSRGGSGSGIGIGTTGDPVRTSRNESGPVSFVGVLSMMTV